jgi:hypothetical protein
VGCAWVQVVCKNIPRVGDIVTQLSAESSIRECGVQMNDDSIDKNHKVLGFESTIFVAVLWSLGRMLLAKLDTHTSSIFNPQS